MATCRRGDFANRSHSSLLAIGLAVVLAVFLLVGLLKGPDMPKQSSINDHDHEHGKHDDSTFALSSTDLPHIDPIAVERTPIQPTPPCLAQPVPFVNRTALPLLTPVKGTGLSARASN